MHRGLKTENRRGARAEAELARSLARSCRGSTLIAGRGVAGLPEAVREQGQEPVSAGDSLPEGRFRTVIAAGLLEHMDPERGKAALHDLRNRLIPGGRLVIAVPNEDCIPDAGSIRRFNRKRLYRALKGLGKVRLATDQPYRWLVMIVTAPRKGSPRPNRAKRNRFRVTSRLCRGRVMELGCGEGHLAKAISDRGLSVTGVDMSAEKIARARALYPEMNFVRADVRDLEAEDGAFDTVVLAEVLEHVHEEPGIAILDRAWKLLRPGGRLIVSVPNEDCVPHRNHVRTFDRRSLKELLGRWGKPRLVTEQPYKWLLMTVRKTP